MDSKEQLKILSNKLFEVRKPIFEEWKLRYPSPSVLYKTASNMMQILQESKIEDDEFKIWQRQTLRELDIFITDINGILGRDYKKRLVRYKGKWDKEMDKIKNIYSDFYSKFIASY